jgi:hypothetical protein
MCVVWDRGGGEQHFFPFIMSPGKLLAEIRFRVPVDK